MSVNSALPDYPTQPSKNSRSANDKVLRIEEESSEEPFFSPKISRVWSMQSNPIGTPPPPPPLNNMTPENGNMEERNLVQAASLWVKVQLPERETCFNNGVHQLELLLKYGVTEEHILMIDLRCPTQFPTERNHQSPEIYIGESSPAEGNPNGSLTPITQPAPPTPSPSNSSETSISGLTPKKIKPPQSQPLPNENACKMCHQKFATSIELIHHLMLYFKPEADVMQTKCPLCSKQFPYPSHLRDHLFTHTKYKPYPCPKCGKGFKRKVTVTIHQRLHHRIESIRRPFHCTRCKKSFSQKSHLTLHMNRVHKVTSSLPRRVLRPRITRLPGRVSTRRAQVMRKVINKKQANNPKKPTNSKHVCHICKKEFQSPSHLRAHIVVHSGKKIPCPKCGKRFNNPSNLRRHQSALHISAPRISRKIHCLPCGKSFVRKQQLAQHLRTIHFKKGCPQCGKGFGQTSRMMRHFLNQSCSKFRKNRSRK